MKPLRNELAKKHAILRSLKRFIKHTALATVPQRFLLHRGPRSSPHVYLTFDDGPHPLHTPHLLDTLFTYNVPATFFVVGELAEQHPEIVSRIVQDGHAIGNHTFHHTRILDSSPGAWIDEVERTSDLVNRLTGKKTVWVRPPYGRLTFAATVRLWWNGYTIALWNVDPRDFLVEDTQYLVDWFATNALQAGDIVLLHDRLPHAALALPTLVRNARESGLEFNTLDSLNDLSLSTRHKG